MHARASLVAYFAVVLFSAHTTGVEATYKYFAGYEPLTNVTKHSMIDLDLANIISGLGSNCAENLKECSGTSSCPTNSCEYVSGTMAFPSADGNCEFTVSAGAKTDSPACSNSYDIWSHGKNSVKTKGMRSIAGFASGAATKGSSASVPYKANAFISIMNKYWKSKGLDEHTWGHQMIDAAFQGTKIGDLDFGKTGRTFRKEAIQKGLVYMNVYPYAIWEMQDQINDCKAQTLTANDDSSVKAWDEAVAFWAGSMTRGHAYGALPPDDNLMYELGDKRCQNFMTCADGFTGTAKVNQELLAFFNRGQILARVGGSAECPPMEDIHDKIGTLMLVPFVQGTLRYLSYTKDAQDAKAAGELWAFATAILPFVAEADANAAEMLYRRAWQLDFTSNSYEEIKSALEATYPKLGAGAGVGLVTCEAVGDLYGNPDTLLSAGTCNLPPQENTTSPLPPPPSLTNTTSPPPPPKLVLDDDDHAAGLAGILVALVATTLNML